MLKRREERKLLRKRMEVVMMWKVTREAWVGECGAT
jgi:hypothetical protein